MTFKHELIAGAFLIVFLSLAALIGYAGYQRNLRQAAEAKLVMVDLELAGAKKALLVKPKDVAPVATPPEIKAAIKKGLVTPIAGVTATAKSNVVYIPCPEVVHPTDESLSKGPEAEADKTAVKSTAPVWFDIKGNLFIGQIKGGNALWTGDFDSRVHSGDFEAPVDFAPENMDIQIKVSDEIGKAVTFYERSWLRKHTAFACPGASLTYNPLNDRAIDIALTCGYSFVWF